MAVQIVVYQHPEAITSVAQGSTQNLHGSLAEKRVVEPDGCEQTIGTTSVNLKLSSRVALSNTLVNGLTSHSA